MAFYFRLICLLSRFTDKAIILSMKNSTNLRQHQHNGKYFGQKSLFLPPPKFGYFLFLPCFFRSDISKIHGIGPKLGEASKFLNFCTYKDLNRKKWQENREIYVRQWKNREVLGFSFIAISFISSLFF